MSWTLAAPATHAIEVKRSRFEAHAAPAASTDDATGFLARTRFADAHHHCWAWRVGAAYRSSDDGEPGGSAGRPILAAIDGQDMDRVVVLVARWFGGTKLGVGGLVRAYGGAASACLQAAPRLPIVARARLRIACGFDDSGAVRNVLAALDAATLEETFDVDGPRLLVELPADRVDALRARLRDATRGQVRIGDNAGHDEHG